MQYLRAATNGRQQASQQFEFSMQCVGQVKVSDTQPICIFLMGDPTL